MEKKTQQQPHDHLQKMKKKNWSHLPEELLTDILLQLPAKSVCGLKCSCKAWYNIIARPFFVKLHLDRTIVEEEEIRLLVQNTLSKKIYSMEPQTSKSSSSSIESFILVKHHGSKLPIRGALTEVLGSCHGVFLVSIEDDPGSLWLWNPLTGDVINLQHAPSTVSISFTGVQYMYGIGCVSNNIDGDYKVIRIRYSRFCPHFKFSRTSDLEIEVMIYSLREASWRVIQSNIDDETILRPFLYDYKWKLDEYCTPYYVGGCVHWLGWCNTDDNRQRRRIMCFDFGTEKFKPMAVPDAQEPGADWASLGVLRGCLSMVYHYDYLNSTLSECVEIFFMKEDGEWRKQHVISQPMASFLNYLQFLCYTKDGKLLAQAWNNRLYLCDPETGSYRRLHLDHPSRGRLVSECTFSAVTYIPSLVSLTSS